MMSLSDVLEDPAAVDADIIEVDLLDETDLHYSSVLMQAVGIEHFKVKGNKYETATAKIRNRI